MKPPTRLFLITTAWTFALLIASNFLAAWFWDLGTGLLPIFGFYTVLFATMLLGFALAWRYALPMKSSWLMAGGIGLNLCFLALLLVLRTAVRHDYLPLAVLEGASATAYWLAFYVLAAVWIPPADAGWYNGWTGTLEAILGLIVPPLSGWTIASMEGLEGYQVVFVAALVSLVSCLWLILGGIRHGSLPAPQTARAKSAMAPPAWRPLMWGFWGLGLRDGIYFFLPNVLLFIISRSALWLGVFVAAEAAAQGALFGILTRRTDDRTLSASLLLATVGSMAALALLWMHLTTITLFALGMLTSLAYPPFKVALESSALAAIGRSSRHEDDRVRLTGLKEVWINGGRLISLGVLVLLTITARGVPAGRFRDILALWGMLPLFIYATYRRYGRSPMNFSASSSAK